MSNLKIFAKTVEASAMEQINNLVSLPAFADCKIRIMPDVHAGAGCVIGFTADLGEKVIPNIVGVDIGCGMLVCELGPVAIDYEQLDTVIRQYVPSGMNVHEVKQITLTADDICCFDELKNVDWIEKSLGTLGGGNHFIEIDEDENENKYLVIHTGSRNLGKQVAEIYQRRAIKACNAKVIDRLAIISKLKEEGRQAEIEQALRQAKESTAKVPDALCWLEGTERLRYLHDMADCQSFARANRRAIAQKILREMGWFAETTWESVHNYIDFEDNIVRKGAICAKKGQKVIIPMNMRDGCIIGRGKGNDDWNCSAPHGAGRIMSRAEARKTVSLVDFATSMDGIWTSSVSWDTIDEAPQVYKPMSEIVELLTGTVEIISIVKPVYNFKASENVRRENT